MAMKRKEHPKGTEIRLTQQHVEAVNRRRSIVVNFDGIDGEGKILPNRPIPEIVKQRFSFADDPDIHIDSIWWNWGEGNEGPYPSEIIPVYNHPGYKKWIQDGIDIVKIFQDETRARGIEVFYSHRMNGSDGDLRSVSTIPMKVKHQDWTHRMPWSPPEFPGYWNYALEPVREHRLEVLGELAEKYDFDGFELDFARGTPFPPGESWVNHEKLTDFVHRLRLMLLDIEKKRGRPFLLAARVPENLLGCHYDGIDVLTWIQAKLVDMLALGCRSYEVDIYTFRRMTDGTHVKLYPVIDELHCSDGYDWPPIEVFRGLTSNWHRQGADGIQLFNFSFAMDSPEHSTGAIQTHSRFYKEMSDPEVKHLLDKTFVIERRGGGHGPKAVPSPEDWSTPQHRYANTNLLARLPASLDNSCRSSTLFTLFVGDDLNATSAYIGSLSLSVLLNDRETVDLPDDKKIERALIRAFRGRNPFYNSPPEKGIEELFEARINNIPLGKPVVKRGWLIFEDLSSRLFAVGDNLMELRINTPRRNESKQILIEKVEVSVRYRTEL